jgi:hypothetical protein
VSHMLDAESTSDLTLPSYSFKARLAIDEDSQSAVRKRRERERAGMVG